MAKAPLIAPEDGNVHIFARNMERYVSNVFRGPFVLTGYSSTMRPDATKSRRAIMFDTTNQVPAYANDAGAWIDLATTANVTSGTYTPTLTAVTNVAASTAYACQYMRVGNVVTVSGKLDVDPTLAASTLLGISLPIASTLSAAEKCAGTAVSNTVASEAAAIEADTINNRAQMEWIAVTLANHSMFFSFTYLIT